MAMQIAKACRRSICWASTSRSAGRSTRRWSAYCPAAGTSWAMRWRRSRRSLPRICHERGGDAVGMRGRGFWYGCAAAGADGMRRWAGRRGDHGGAYGGGDGDGYHVDGGYACLRGYRPDDVYDGRRTLWQRPSPRGPRPSFLCISMDIRLTCEAWRRWRRSHGLRVIEDCAQAHGARYDGRAVGYDWRRRLLLVLSRRRISARWATAARW